MPAEIDDADDRKIAVDPLPDPNVSAVSQKIQDLRLEESSAGPESAFGSDDDVIDIPDLAGGDAFEARRLRASSGDDHPHRLFPPQMAEVGRFSRFSVSWADVAAPESLKRRLQLIAEQWSATLRLLQGSPAGATKVNDNGVGSANRTAGNGELAVSGVLLHGPSGSGKSLVARALVAAVGLPCLELSAADIRSRWLGDSERLLRQAFRECQANAPCVLLLDDIEQMAGQRAAIATGQASDARGLEYRVLSTLLNCLDGIDGGTLAKARSDSDVGVDGGDGDDNRMDAAVAGIRNIFVVACSRNLEAVDQALVRPGRLEVILELEQPQTAEKIEAVLRAHIHRSGVPVSPTLSLEKLAARLAREQPELARTAAEICHVIQEASLNALRRDIEATEILPEDVVDALE